MRIQCMPGVRVTPNIGHPLAPQYRSLRASLELMHCNKLRSVRAPNPQFLAYIWQNR